MKSCTIADKPQIPATQAVRFADCRAKALLESHLAELSDPDGHGWRRVKHNASRTVYRGSIHGQDIYLKHYHNRSRLRRALRRIGASDALYEMQFAEYLAANDVPTFRALAAVCCNGVEWLASEAIEPAESADVWHLRHIDAGPDAETTVREALMALAELVGRLHRAGVIHRDLHCGNVLVRTDTPKPQPVLMDLHRAVRRRRLSRRSMAANLAQLYHDRAPWTTRTQRLRFLKHYLRTTGAGGTLRGWQGMIEQLAERHCRRQHAQRDRRISGRNIYFSDIRLPGGWSGRVTLASKRRMAGSRAAQLRFTVEQWAEALADPLDLLTGPETQLIKDSPSVRVVRRKLTVGGHELDVFIKQPRRKHRWKVLLDCFRRTRPARAFRLGHELLTRRIATALPLAQLRRRVGPLVTDSILITEAVEAQRLNDFLNTWLATPLRSNPDFIPAQQRHLAQQVLWQLGRLLRSLHENNYAHRDLKATNILVRWSGKARPELILIDLDGLRPVRRVTQRQRFQGLMRLNVSLLNCPVVNHAGRLRMLLGYLRRPGSGKINFKPYWRTLELWSSKKLRQQIRSRRKRQKVMRKPNR